MHDARNMVWVRVRRNERKHKEANILYSMHTVEGVSNEIRPCLPKVTREFFESGGEIQLASYRMYVLRGGWGDYFSG